jgi:hypothetical protein
MESVHEHNHKWYKFGCKDATLLLTKKDYAPLTFTEKILLKFHLTICIYCSRFKKQTAKINEFFRAAAEGENLSLSSEKKQALNQLITKNNK